MRDKIAIIAPACVACGLCVRWAPDLFAVVGHRVARVRVRIVDGQDAELAREVADACPTEAITVEPIPSP
jgi:ferredoxin